MPRVKKIEEPQGKVLNIDAALAKKPRNRIERVGVELEGGWKALPEGITQLEVDTSVFKHGERQRIPPGLLMENIGELPIGPMVRASVRRVVTRYYPDVVDATCGLHVHMGFGTVYQYSLLADSPDFQETVIDYLGRWGKEEGLPENHPLWPRLLGTSTYCQKKFWPQEQMRQTRKGHDRDTYGHRYTMIHYCWGRYQTVECRVLPMMETSAQAIRAITRLFDITNAYLLTVDKSKIKDYGKLELDNGDLYEEEVETRL